MNLIKELYESKKQTEAYYDLSEGDLNKSYGIKKWNVRQILVHLSDAESVLHERIKRIISEPKPSIIAFDQDLWCENLDYEKFPLAISKSFFFVNRLSIIYLAEQFYVKNGNKEFLHSQTGIRTLKDEFDKVASHNFGHLKQIELALTIFKD